MDLTDQVLQETHKRLRTTYQGLWQDYFALHYLLDQEFGLSESQAAGQIAFGGNDYGIDAFHIAVRLGNLYLYQFKWSLDHKQFATSIRRLVDAGLERIFGNPTQDQRQNVVVDQLKYALDEKRDAVKRVYIHCVFRGGVEAAEKSKYLEALREDLEDKRFLLEGYFGRPVDMTLEFISTEQGRRGARAKATQTRVFDLTIRNSCKAAPTPDGHAMVVGFVPLHQLHGFYQAMRDRLFERNIRFGLKSENAPNRAIRKSIDAIVLKATEPPESFAYYHNGVSIAAQALTENGDSFRIVEPRILNGAQTVTSAQRFLELNERNPVLQDNADRWKAIEVLAKIVVSPTDPGFVTRVTINNNRQNPVEPWNLRANDDIQLRFQDEFDKRHFYYERQEGAFSSLTDEDLEERGIDGNKAITLKHLAKTFLAVQGEIKKMSSLVEVFESDAVYSKTFREAYLDCDFRDLLLCYKTGLRVNAMVREIEDKGEQKYWYISRAKNLVWALCIQGLMNGYDIPSLRDGFGRDLRIPASLSETYREIASTRVRLIIKAVAEREYADELPKEKLSFLQSNTMFDSCMAQAKKLYKWERWSLG